MSDIRNPSNLRLNRPPPGTQQGDTVRTEGATGQPTRVETTQTPATTTAPALLPTHMVGDAAETGSQNNQNLAVTGRGGQSAGSGAPATPVSRLGSAGPDPHAGARSFISNLHALHFNESNDSDSMTSAFLKLEATNMSTNQSIEGYLNQAKHFLREAAFKIEKELSKQNPDALLQQADQLEKQAADMVKQALADSGQSGGKLSQVIDEMEQGNDVAGSATDQVAAEAWQHVYDSADRAIRDSATAYQEEADAKAAGDSAAASAAHDRADAAEGRARTMLEAAGITVTQQDGDAIGKLALQMKAAGDNSNVMTKFLDLHPEKAQALLPAETYNQVKSQGGEAIVQAIMKNQASQGDAMSTMSLGLAMSASDQQGLSEIQGMFPEASAIQGTLGQAAAMLKQAYDLRMRAYTMKEALLDAQNAIHEGKTDDGQFGVQRRNMEGQNEIMRGLTRLLGGSRADQQSREDANLEARRARPEVVQLMKDFVERDRANAVRRGTGINRA